MALQKRLVVQKTLGRGKTAREGILTTNYFFVADNVGHIKNYPLPLKLSFSFIEYYPLHLQLPFLFIDISSTFLPVSYTHLDVYKRQVCVCVGEGGSDILGRKCLISQIPLLSKEINFLYYSVHLLLDKWTSFNEL